MAKGAPSLALVECNFFVGLSFHEALVPVPPVVVEMILPHGSLGLVQGFYLFANLSSVKGQQVKWNNLHYVGRTSDAALLVPHIGMIQPMLPFTILFGSSMAVWGSSATSIATHCTILGNGSQSMACSCFPRAHVSLNLGCSWPVPIPLDVVGLFGTTWVSFTWGDFVAGLIDIAIQMAIEAATVMLGALVKKIPFAKVASKLKGPFIKSAEMAEEEAGTKAAEEAMEVSFTAAKRSRSVSESVVRDVASSDSYLDDLIRSADDEEIQILSLADDAGSSLDEEISKAASASEDVEVEYAAKEASAAVKKPVGVTLGAVGMAADYTSSSAISKLGYAIHTAALEYAVQISERACEIGNSRAEGVDDDQFEIFAYYQPLQRDVVIGAVNDAAGDTGDAGWDSGRFQGMGDD